MLRLNLILAVELFQAMHFHVKRKLYVPLSFSFLSALSVVK